MVKETAADAEMAARKKYVRDGIYDKGGFGEAFSGLSHKTLPFLIGLESSLTPSRFGALFVRVALFCAAALFPIVVRKAITGSANALAPAAGSFSGAVDFLSRTFQNLDSLDYVLGAIAVTITGLPKLFDVLGRKKDVSQHSPYYDLAAAIQGMPPCTDKQAVPLADEPLKLVLSALRIEMSELIGDESKRRVTDVTLLEFCDDAGTHMQVRARTANHEPVQRPVPSFEFVAYFVALEGRAFAEHDFLSHRNPFPKTRLSVVGSPPVEYRSVLYVPIVCSQRVSVGGNSGERNGGQAMRVVDSCIGVICVHSSKPYRFWRWGDQSKTTGGFADVAFERSMPYIAIVKRLLEQSASKVPLETT